MKDTVTIVVFATVFALLALRLYRRFKGEDAVNRKTGKNKGLTSPEDDGYEPYSNKGGK